MYYNRLLRSARMFRNTNVVAIVGEREREISRGRLGEEIRRNGW